MIDAIAKIQSMLALGAQLYAVASGGLDVIRRAHAEGRDLTEEELDQIRALDDSARADLQRALAE